MRVSHFKDVGNNSHCAWLECGLTVVLGSSNIDVTSTLDSCDDLAPLTGSSSEPWRRRRRAFTSLLCPGVKSEAEYSLFVPEPEDRSENGRLNKLPDISKIRTLTPEEEKAWKPRVVRNMIPIGGESECFLTPEAHCAFYRYETGRRVLVTEERGVVRAVAITPRSGIGSFQAHCHLSTGHTPATVADFSVWGAGLRTPEAVEKLMMLMTEDDWIKRLPPNGHLCVDCTPEDPRDLIVEWRTEGGQFKKYDYATKEWIDADTGAGDELRHKQHSKEWKAVLKSVSHRCSSALEAFRILVDEAEDSVRLIDWDTERGKEYFLCSLWSPRSDRSHPARALLQRPARPYKGGIRRILILPPVRGRHLPNGREDESFNFFYLIQSGKATRELKYISVEASGLPGSNFGRLSEAYGSSQLWNLFDSHKGAPPLNRPLPLGTGGTAIFRSIHRAQGISSGYGYRPPPSLCISDLQRAGPSPLSELKEVYLE